MKLLVDMNLSPLWCGLLESAGHEATHWSTIGPNDAPDPVVMGFARERGMVVFTHDLDFGTILALTAARAPSVLQIRSDNVLPDSLGNVVLAAVEQFKDELLAGAIVVVEPAHARARLLPLGDKPGGWASIRGI